MDELNRTDGQFLYSFETVAGSQLPQKSYLTTVKKIFATNVCENGSDFIPI